MGELGSQSDEQVVSVSYTQVVEADGLRKEEAASRREIWGWYMYDFAANAFYSVALPVFFPLLLTTLANQQAYAELGQDALPDCADGVGAPCLICQPGSGTMLNTTTGLQAYPQPKVTAGALHIDPVAYATIMAGLAVIMQVLFFITFGPLADYGLGRKHMLIVGTVSGSVVMLLCLCLVSPSLWWLAGLFLVLTNVFFGLAAICFSSYLAVLTEASPEVLEASLKGGSKQLQMEAREKVSNQISLTAIAVGSVGAVLCLGAAAGLTLSTPDQALQLRLATAFSGAWWLSFSFFTFFWLKPRPGPPMPPQGLSILCGWRRILQLVLEARRFPNSLWFLLCYFIYSDGYITLTQIGVLYGQRNLCMGNTSLLLLVASVSFWALFGAVLAYWVQRWSRWGNKTMLLILLTSMVPLPLWGLLGYLTSPDGVGLKHVWEVFVFSAWFGLALGPTLSYSRVVFIDLIPVGTEATFFSLYSISDKGSSWLGPFFAALVVQFTGQLRPSFLYILIVMVVPLFMLIFLVNHKQGLADAGRSKESSAVEPMPESALQI